MYKANKKRATSIGNYWNISDTIQIEELREKKGKEKFQATIVQYLLRHNLVSPIVNSVTPHICADHEGQISLEKVIVCTFVIVARTHQNMYNRHIFLNIILKATTNINNAIIDKQPSVN